MSYEIRFKANNELKGFTRDVEEAKTIARAMAAWNHHMLVVDSESKQVVYEAEALRT